jgi:diguanylate cyclase (GGDEF)-like protein
MIPTLDPPVQTPEADPVPPSVLSGLLSAVLAQRGDLLAVKDLMSHRIVHVNEAMAAFLRRPLDEVLGRTDLQLFEPALTGALRVADQTAVAQGQALLSEHRFDWSGVRREFSVLRVAMPPDANGRRLLCSVWTDLAAERQRETQLQLALQQIEEQQRAQDAMRRDQSDQALRDPASGLYRRAHFEDQLRRDIDLSTREQREFSLVLIELDPLRPEVRALGAIGLDRIVEALGRLLRSGTRAMDASCRYDDRRFAVLLSGVGLATAHARMEGLRRRCATHIVVHHGQELSFGVAMGVASFPHTADTMEGLIEACDIALTDSRQRGGNHVALASIRFEGEGA